ncbi:hypothetical protein AMELA_G00175180 [Ameiurus melas]|uniref:Uncharacterized protein n=1 Tax=Ameiurus melas TaxID=219545 RepID=A0A7J6AH17_AMEME|nr:hypothetical protein AMELA_G00175180 [Ameiurus melas]
MAVVFLQTSRSSILRDEPSCPSSLKMNQVQVNKTCAELCRDGKYIYSISLPDNLQKDDCYHSWKSQDETVLDFGRFLSRGYCEHGIRYIVRCISPKGVLNSTTPAPEPYGSNNATVTSVLPRSHVPTIFVATFILMLLVILFAVLCYKKMK